MHIDFTPFAVLWAVLALAVAAMALYRRTISAKDDESLHLTNPTVASRQVEIAHKLEVIDKWGKLLTVIAAIYGLLLVIAYTYQNWIRATNLGV